MACRFTELVLDCHDHHRLGEFWGQVLGYRIAETSEGPEDYYVQLEGPAGAGPTILVVRTPDAKSSKNRVHIDVNATDRDQDAEVERILALGPPGPTSGRASRPGSCWPTPRATSSASCARRSPPTPAEPGDS